MRKLSLDFLAIITALALLSALAGYFVTAEITKKAAPNAMQLSQVTYLQK